MASSSSSTPVTLEEIVTLQSKDGHLFDITKSEALQSILLKNMIEDTSSHRKQQQPAPDVSVSSSSITTPPSNTSTTSTANPVQSAPSSSSSSEPVPPSDISSDTIKNPVQSAPSSSEAVPASDVTSTTTNPVQSCPSSSDQCVPSSSNVVPPPSIVPGEPISVSNVDGRTLSVVTAYLKKHANPQVSEEEKELYDLEEIATKPLVELFYIFLAADYLEIKGLIDVVCKAIADNIKDFPVERVREIFHVENDFTPEEEERLRLEQPWVHEN